eukprot:53726-Eustigmatos_ZCMA.PRE.1
MFSQAPLHASNTPSVRCTRYSKHGSPPREGICALVLCVDVVVAERDAGLVGVGASGVKEATSR